MKNIMFHQNKWKKDSKYSFIVSLDKHTKTTYVIVMDKRTGHIIFDKNIIGGNKAILKALSNICNPKKSLVILEAGGHGFSCYRFFRKHGYGCKLIAPSSRPKRGKEQKTDRDDAFNQLNYYMAGLLSFVWIPSEVEEDARELIRYRYQKVWQLSKVKQLIQAMMRRYDKEYNLTKSYWTKTHYRWLHSVELLPGARLILDFRLEELSRLSDKVSMIDKELDLFFDKNQQAAQLLQYYRILPGIGRVNGMTYILEGFDLKRFPHANHLMSYTGLVPKKKASGDRDPAMHITKAGNKLFRTALVGAAKFYRDRRLLISSKKLKQLPEELQPFVSKTQEYLFHRYRLLRSKGKPGNKARVAVARELCAALWELSNKVIPAIKYDIFNKAA